MWPPCASCAQPADARRSKDYDGKVPIRNWPPMGLRLLRIVMLVIPILLECGIPASAQYYGYPPGAPPPYPQQRRDPRAYPPGYYPGKLVQPAQPGFSLRRLFGGQEPPVMAPPQVMRPRRVPPRAPVVVRREKPKADPTTQV